GEEVQISNSLTESGTVTDIKSILNIEGDGNIQLTKGSFSFNKIIFTINENARSGYILSGTATSTQISISSCIMKMVGSIPQYSILTVLVELIGGDLGSGIYAQILSSGALTIEGTSSFVYCKARLDLGASLYSTISGANRKLILEDEILFERFMKYQERNKKTQFGQGRGAYIELSNDEIIEVNEILFNECKGINGGGIQINSLSAQKQTFNGTQFTNCVADENGGGLYCVINSGEIELNEVIISGCFALEGGGIYSQIDGTGKLTIKDSCSFTSCSSTGGNGGGIYIDIDFSTQSQISVQSTRFEYCQALNPQISDINKGYGSGIFIFCINC
ncbi:MAG: hypothetical protein EZS28_043222, partial [Streblomastix strix]